METSGRGIIILVAGLYGAGKTTLVGAALEALPELRYIMTYTTRAPRPAELLHGTHEYQFVDQAEYDKLCQMPGWDHTQLRGASYGSDAAGVSEQAVRGQPFIVNTTMEEVQIAEMRSKYAASTCLVLIDTDYETCRRRVLAAGSGRSAAYATDPTQSPTQAARIRTLADCVFRPQGLVAADGPAFADFIAGILRQGDKTANDSTGVR